jgi:hypothetical protein
LSRDECTLWIDALGVRNVPLPALARTPPWVVAVERAIHAVEAWLRALHEAAMRRL